MPGIFRRDRRPAAPSNTPKSHGRVVVRSSTSRFGSTRKGGADADTGIVDQNVKVLALPLCLQNSPEIFDKRVKGRAVGKIELEGCRFPAGIFDFLHNLFGVCLLAVIGQDDVISFRGDVQGDALTETAASAGYECDFHCSLLSKLVILMPSVDAANGFYSIHRPPV